MRFEWNQDEVTEEQRQKIEEFLERVQELGIENAFYDQEALVFIDGTHLIIPEGVRVITD